MNRKGTIDDRESDWIRTFGSTGLRPSAVTVGRGPLGSPRSRSSAGRRRLLAGSSSTALFADSDSNCS